MVEVVRMMIIKIRKMAGRRIRMIGRFRIEGAFG